MKKLLIAALFLISCSQTGSYSQSSNYNCTVQTISSSNDAPFGGTLLTCGTQSSLILNGQTTYSIAQIIDPCGQTPGYFNEVLLKMAGGQILALFVDNSSGLNARLALIPAGNFITTDGTNCNFSVDSLGNITW